MPTSSDTASSSAQRLPVNPRRRKVAPQHRKRVSTACNGCNIRRVKCSGDKPCSQCVKAGRECQYPAGKQEVSFTRTEFEELRVKCALLEQCLEEAVPDESRRSELLGRARSQTVLTDSDNGWREPNSADDEQTPTEGRVLHDPDGTARYLGESSGATFLDHVKEFMATVFPLAFNNSWPGPQNPETTFIASLGSYQTHDSRPLTVPNVDPLWLPSRTEAFIMLADLRYFIQDGNGDFPSGGIYFWGDMDLILRNIRAFSDSATGLGMDRNLALYNAAFAMACQLGTACSPRSDTSLEETFFARARILLGNPLDNTTISDVSVLALMGFYLMGMNRRDAAYIYISVAMHILIMHGVHRGWMVDEQGKRIFWTVYILDRWLSCLMGRPPMILDEAIKIDLPHNTSDTPPAAGIRAHVELSRISDYIVCNVYQIARREHEAAQTSINVEKSLRMLSSWLEDLPTALRISDGDLSNDRACCELHMAYNQLLLLTIRPILFVAVKKAVADRYISGQSHIENHPQISKICECSDAARRNLRLGRWILQLGRSPRLLQAGLHHVFNAAVILLLHQILFDDISENDASDISFATAVFESEASGSNNYAKDCARVLTDLSSLVRQLRSQNPLVCTHVGTPSFAPESQGQTPTTAESYANGMSINTERMNEGTFETQVQALSGTLHRHMNEDHPAYDELFAWLNDDDMQLAL